MTGSARSDRFVKAVTSGRQPACKWVRLAVARHVADLKRKGFDYRFDPKKADRACAFIERLPHVKGEWALPDPATGHARKIVLEDWQCFFVCSVFGWVNRKTGLRRFRAADVFLPRKNTKSTLAASIGLYMLTDDGEPGAEVYCGAVSKAQAMEVFRPARQMCIAEPDLPDAFGIEVNVSSLVVPDTNARFEPVIGRPRDGSSPHCGIIDEYHQHADSALYQSMRTGMGARRQPLLLNISTAGDNVAGPCREEWLICEKLLLGTFEDETHFALIFTCDEDDDWTTEAALRKANPNWGISVNPSLILADQKRAIQDVAFQADFKTKHLNLWVGSVSGFFNVESWTKLARPTKLEAFAGKAVHIGCDFAAKSDLTVSIQLFPDGDDFQVFGRYYLPRATVDLPQNRHYRTWEQAGWLTVTPGNITDQKRLVRDVIEFAAAHQVVELNYDPNRVYGIATELQEAGLNVVPLSQERRRLSIPMRHLADLIAAGKIHHNGDPVLAWAMSNVCAGRNRRDEIYPYKETEDKKIDPAVALMMALHGAMLAAATPPPAPVGVGNW